VKGDNAKLIILNYNIEVNDEKMTDLYSALMSIIKWNQASFAVTSSMMTSTQTMMKDSK
jgi:hypothetical protein